MQYHGIELSYDEVESWKLKVESWKVSPPKSLWGWRPERDLIVNIIKKYSKIFPDTLWLISKF